jgi:O-antigen ligase
VVIFTLLVIGSFAGFFVIQRAKHTPTLVQEARLESQQTATPTGPRTIEELSFHIAHPERVTVSIVNSGGETVRTLVAGMPLRAYQPVSLSWDGLTSTGARAPQGTYRVRLYLHGQRREVFFPTSFELLTPGRHARQESPQLHYLRHHTAVVAIAGVASLLVIVALALLFYRWPQAFALAAVFTLPFRLPISTQGTTANLLIPLYLVIGGGALAYLLTVLRPGRRWGAPAGQGDTPSWSPWTRRLPTRAEIPSALEWLLVASVVLYAIGAIYSSDVNKALENLVFFYVPFLIMFGLLRRLQWTRRLLLACLGVAVFLALVLSGIGFVEYARKQLFLNPKVVAANQYSNYFRVNSLFFDPNIYGRFLALVMIAVAALVMAPRGEEDPRSYGRRVIAGGVVLVWLWCGLMTSLSQSSIAALLVGLGILAAWRWDTRSVIYVAVALVAIAGAVWLAAPSGLHVGLSGTSANEATNGRTNLISGGLRLFSDRPLQGFGSGSFAREYVDHHLAATTSSTTASHTIPITVAAEQGLIGLLLYAGLLLAAFATLFDGASRSSARILLAACFAALVVHTFVYADFLEDPFTWVLLALGVALAVPSFAPARSAPGPGRPQDLAPASAGGVGR